MVRQLLLIIFLLIPASLYAQLNPLTAYVDRTEVSLNDVFVLTLRVNSALSSTPPSLNALEQNFEQEGFSTSSSFTLINNVSESWTEYRISLRPKTAGTLTIPAFQIGAELTDPITITVSAAPANPANNMEDFFLRTTLNKDSVYVQEQLLYTVKIYFAAPFDQGAQLGSPEAGDAVIQQLGNDSSYQEVINGLRYNVIERHYVMFPQSSGTLQIEPITFTATVGRRRTGSIFNSRTTGGRPINLLSEAHELTVKSKPASFPASATWLPSSNLVLQESWSRDLQGIAVGEAVTRNLSIRAEGISSSLLPGVEFAESNTVKFYPDQPNREDMATENGVTGIRSQGTAIVASEGGDFTLPAIEIPWWNTLTDTLQYARLPEYTMNVSGAGNITENTDPNAQTSNNSIGLNNAFGADRNTGSSISNVWIYTTVIFILAWLYSSRMWYRYQSRLKQVSANSIQVIKPSHKEHKATEVKTSGTNSNTAFQVLQFACKENNLSNIRQALLNWGRSYFENENLLSLEQLKNHVGAGKLQDMLTELESAMYGAKANADNFDSTALLRQVKALHKKGRPRMQKKATGEHALPPLYRN